MFSAVVVISILLSSEKYVALISRQILLMDILAKCMEHVVENLGAEKRD